uniref:Uncharacterized protein n=1 Tax=Anguilla anguilla TaxID=7936 RepID=A0A0E9PAP1_ANGAN
MAPRATTLSTNEPAL